MPFLSEAEAKRRNVFLRCMRPFAAYAVAQMCNRMTPGVNWIRCSKSHIADAYARKEHGFREIETERLKLYIRDYLEKTIFD